MSPQLSSVSQSVICSGGIEICHQGFCPIEVSITPKLRNRKASFCCWDFRPPAHQLTMDPSLVAFSFEEFLFSSFSLLFGSCSRFLVPARKQGSMIQSMFLHFLLLRKHDTDLKNFECFWGGNCQHCWSNCKAISKLCKRIGMFGLNETTGLGSQAMSWCPWERRSTNQLSHVLGEVTSQQWCEFVCFFALLVTSLCSLWTLKKPVCNRFVLIVHFNHCLWVWMKKQGFSWLFLFLQFSSNQVFVLALSKRAGKHGKGAGKEDFPEHWMFLLLPPWRNTKTENATKDPRQLDKNSCCH